MTAAAAEPIAMGHGSTELQNHPHRRDAESVSVSRSLPLEKLQATFDENYHPLTKPVKHVKTLVLLFSWDKTDMDVTDEIARLRKVFEDEYCFDVREEVLKTSRPNPQMQLNKALADFAYDIDGPNLGIVYYAGHGFAETPGELHLTTGSNQKAREEEERQYNRVAWHSAEMCFSDTEADILVIFDCCSAGSLQGRSPRDKCFEFLGACEHEEGTAFPGEYSFTSALIHALRKLKDRQGFTSQELRKELSNAPKFHDKNQHPVLFHRGLTREDHVWIPASGRPGKIPARISSPTGPSSSIAKGRQMEYLDMRFRFGKALNESQITQFAKELSRFTKSHERTLAIENIILMNHTVLIKDILRRWRGNTGSKSSLFPADMSSYGNNEQVTEPQTVIDEVSGSQNLRFSQRLRLDVIDLLEQVKNAPNFSPRRPHIMALKGFVAGTILTLLFLWYQLFFVFFNLFFQLLLKLGPPYDGMGVLMLSGNATCC